MCNCQNKCECRPFDPTKPVQCVRLNTGRAYPARILATDRKSAYPEGMPIIALVEGLFSPDTEASLNFRADGTGSHYRLVNIPEVVVKYACVSNDMNKGYFVVSIGKKLRWDTVEEARKFRDTIPDKVAGITKLTFADGKLTAVELVESY